MHPHPRPIKPDFFFSTEKKTPSKQGGYYYPFGMEIKERTWQASKYRHGFNGMYKDDEIKGSGNSLDFGARIYDSRLGKWMSPDPLFKNYPYLTPYNFASNSPVLFLDFDGTEIVNPYDTKTEKEQYIKVQTAINIVKVVLPELYEKLNSQTDVRIEIRIDESLAKDFQQKKQADIGNTTTLSESGKKTHTLGETHGDYPGLGKYDVEPTFDENGKPNGCKVIAVSYDQELDQVIVTEILIENIDDVSFGTNEKGVIITLAGGLEFTETLGKVLSHELGHTEYNMENPAKAGLDKNAKSYKEGGHKIPTDEGSENAAQQRDREFSENYRKTPRSVRNKASEDAVKDTQN